METAPDTLHISDAQLATIDAAIEALEANLYALISLTDREREGMTEMVDSTETFCRQTLMRLLLNPHLNAHALDMAQANEDLRTLDRLRPRLQRLHALGERANDTRLMLGNYVIMASLVGYSLLKSVGKEKGLEELRDTLSYTSGRRRKPRDAAPGPAP